MFALVLIMTVTIRNDFLKVGDVPGIKIYLHLT